MHTPPPQPPEEDDNFLDGCEGVIHPHSPDSHAKVIQVEEPLLFLLSEVDLSTKKRK